MIDKFIISVPAKSINKSIFTDVNCDVFSIDERKPIGPQASMSAEITYHCFVEITNGMLAAFGEHLFIEYLLPLLQKKIEKPTIIKSGGSVVETEITKYLERLALRVVCPIYKEKMGREVETEFYFLVDPSWSKEEISFGVTLFKNEMKKIISHESSMLDNILSHHLVAYDVILSWDKETAELFYLGPIPKHILDKTL